MFYIIKSAVYFTNLVGKFLLHKKNYCKFKIYKKNNFLNFTGIIKMYFIIKLYYKIVILCGNIKYYIITKEIKRKLCVGQFVRSFKYINTYNLLSILLHKTLTFPFIFQKWLILCFDQPKSVDTHLPKD